MGGRQTDRHTETETQRAGGGGREGGRERQTETEERKGRRRRGWAGW